MTSHPDVEALAFFAEDLLAPGEERSVADHIDTCAICAVTLAELNGVTRALAEVPAPALPPDVSGLLDERIAEAAAERSMANGPVQGPRPETPLASVPSAKVTPIAARRRGFGLPKLLMVAAVAVFVLGGGSAVIGNLMTDQQPESSAASPLLEETEEEGAPDTAQSYSAEGVRSETLYTEDTLTEQAGEVLAAAESEEGMGSQSGESSELPDGAQECVTRFEATTGTRVTLVDDARWEGPADSERVWVLFARGDEGVDVVVVDPACARGGDISTNVLAQGSL